MKIEDDTVVFKSEPYYFKEERDGLKPNTVRLLPYDENLQPRLTGFIKKIRIECTVESDMEDFELFQNFAPFTRTLTSIEQIGELCGYYLFVFSWRHEEEEVKQ